MGAKKIMKTVNELFEEAKGLDYDSFGMGKLEEMRPFGFFPGGRGTYDKGIDICNKEIMIVGNDFGKWDELPIEGENKLTNPTWVNLLCLLREIEIAEKNSIYQKCFFTNAYMGLRIGGSNIGPCPGSKYPQFIEQCEDFLTTQINCLHKLKLVIVLGKKPLKILKKNYPRLAAWEKKFEDIDANENQIISSEPNKELIFVIITHPSFAPSNWKNRSYREFKGREAEVEILKEAMKEAGLLKSL